MAHWLADPLTTVRAHVGLLNEPPAPPSLHDTVPLGVVGELLVSVTVAVKVIALPAITDEGLGVTTVPVLWGGGPEAATIASTSCDPDSPTLRVKPSVVPLWGEETTLYSVELAIHEGTCWVRMELYEMSVV